MFIATLALWGATLAATPRVPDFDAFFREFAEKRAHVKVLEADFTQTTILPDETLATTGVLRFAQPRRFHIRTEEPRRETLLDHRRGYEYEADLEQVLVFDIENSAQASIFFLGFDNDTAALREAYDVHLFDVVDDDTAPRGLLIKPKPGDDDALFQEVSLYLRGEDMLPYRIRIVNDAESTVVLDLTDVRVNHMDVPTAPHLDIPEGVKIVQNDRVVETVGPGGKRLPEPVFAGAHGDAAQPVDPVESPSAPDAAADDGSGAVVSVTNLDDPLAAPDDETGANPETDPGSAAKTDGDAP